MAGIHFDVTGDNKNFINALNGAEAGVKKTSKAVEQSGKSIEDMFEGIRNAAAGALAGFTVTEFVKKVASARSEIQSLELTFTTMLGSADKANKMMQQLIQTAAITPFSMTDVMDGAKQLLAFGIEAENVNDTLVRLGDIAAGTGAAVGQLTNVYGQIKAAGKMNGGDLLQFINAGVPIINSLANAMNVAESEVKDLISAGKVGFPEVQQAIKNLTDEGGTFGGLMEAQSSTIEGQISTIEDNIDQMFAAIGKESESIINGALGVASSLVDNYERVGRVLLSLVATYGTYKAAVMAAAAIETLRVAGIGALSTAEAAHYGWLVLCEKAQKLLNATMLKNPYVLVATAIAAGVAAMVSMQTETERLRDAEERYQAAKQETLAKEKEHKQRLEELISVAGDEAISTKARRDALAKLEQMYPSIFAKYDTEFEKLKNIKQIKEEIAALDAKNTISSTQNELNSVEKRIQELQSKTKTTTEYYQDNMKQWRSRVVTVSARTDEEDAELANLLNKRTSLNKQVRQEEINAAFENLTGLSNDTLEREIKRRKSLLASMQTNEKQYGTITQGYQGVRGTFSRDELQYQVNKLTSELNKRTAKKDSSSEWVKSVTEEYTSAVKAYNDFISNTSNSLTKEDYEKKVKELKDAADKAKKEYDKITPLTDKEQKSQDKAEKANEKRLEASRKIAQEQTDIELQNQEDTLSLMEDGTEKRLALIDNEYEERKAKIAKQAQQLSKENKKAGIAGGYSLQVDDVSINGLSEEQKEALTQSLSLNDQKKAKQTQDVYKEEASAMREFLKEYGTYQQQKLAITEDYAQRIAKAATEGERKALQAQQSQELQQLEVNAIRQQIDWGSIFGDFGSMFKDQLQPAIDNLRKVAPTLQLDEQKTVYEMIEKLETASASWNGDVFSEVSDGLEAYQTAMENYAKAIEDERSASERLADAQNRLNDNPTDIKASSDVDAAQKDFAEASERVRTFGGEVQRTTSELNTSSAQAKSMLQDVTSSLQGLTSGSLSGIGNSLKQIDKLFNNSEATKDVANVLANGFTKLFGKDSEASKKITELFGDTGLAGEIISATLSLLDILSEGISGLVTSLIDTVMSSVNGILDDVLSGDFAVNIGTSLKDGIGNILDTVTFGGVSSWLSGSNAKYVQELTENLTDSNDRLRDSVDRLKESIDESAGGSAVSDYQEAYAAQERIIEQTMQILREQMGYHGAHQSNRHYWNLSDEAYSAINALLGTDVQSLNDIYELTPEQMNDIRTYLVDVWDEMLEQGKYDKSEYWDDYADLADTLSDLTDQIKENLTQTSFDSLRDNFLETLMDMDASASDFADDFEEYMQKALLNYALGDIFDEQLQAWYDNWATAMQDGSLTSSQIEAYRDEWAAMVDDALDLRDSIAELTGYSGDGYSQTSSSGTWESMSEETAQELNGRFTAVQLHTSDTAERMLMTVNLLTAMSATQATQSQILSEMRTLMVYSNGYLEDVAKYSKLSYSQMCDKLDSIISNTKNL